MMAFFMVKRFLMTFRFSFFLDGASQNTGERRELHVIERGTQRSFAFQRSDGYIGETSGFDGASWNASHFVSST